MDNNDKNKRLDQQNSEELKRAGKDAGSHKYEDPSGTDPDRYENSGDDEDRLQKPKKHTTPDERMINPDRGEK